MSTNAPSWIHHNLRPNGANDFLFQIDGSNFRLYMKNSDPIPIYRQDTEEDPDDSETNSGETHEFAYERDLKNFLSNNR